MLRHGRRTIVHYIRDLDALAGAVGKIDAVISGCQETDELYMWCICQCGFV